MVWSPVCAWEGEPFGMLRTDIKVVAGNRQPTIISEIVPLPVAIVEMPIALLMDTVLLPLALVRSLR